MNHRFLLFILLFTLNCQSENEPLQTDVLILGDGTGATSAAIQSARSGANTILVTSLPWLGGMLTSAGVSATDGNHRLPAGLWGEFRDSLRKHYGGEEALFTGWVSNTQFEPSVGNEYWQQIARKEENLTILFEKDYESIERADNRWDVQLTDGQQISAKILVDGTDLGDVAAQVGASFDVGMEARAESGEGIASEEANDIIQDMTYAIILKDFGEGADKTIERPEDYDPSLFDCACAVRCEDETAKPHPCPTMLNYGKLPNDKYMINWPLKGNDYYVNIIDMNRQEREAALEEAKNKTLQFVYYIQHELGFKELGIAEDEFPSEDGFPLMPYHREGRRIDGLVRLNVNHLLQPYNYSLYRTGIAVGDYPIDHHHYERPDAPEIDFPKVPSFNIPLGALIPEGVDDLIIADKAISVSNIVNGSSRLQPVIIQIGQVAGLLAALCIEDNSAPKDVNIRVLQDQLLKANGYLQPFIDVSPTHPHFESIQRIGATGILRGKGIPYKWANQTWFYPDTTISAAKFIQQLAEFDAVESMALADEEVLSVQDAIEVINEWQIQKSSSWKRIQLNEDFWLSQQLTNFSRERPITKAELAVLLDNLTPIFDRPVNWKGEFKK